MDRQPESEGQLMDKHQKREVAFVLGYLGLCLFAILFMLGSEASKNG